MLRGHHVFHVYVCKLMPFDTSICEKGTRDIYATEEHQIVYRKTVQDGIVEHRVV